MRSIANYVANAGIGAEIKVNGLDQLIKANSTLQELYKTAQKIKNITSNFTFHISGNPELEQTLQRIRKIHHDFTSNVNVHTSGMNTLDKLQNRLDWLKQSHNKLNIDTSSLNKAQHQLNDLRRSMRMNVNTSGSRSIDELNDKIRQTSENMHNMGSTSRNSFNQVGDSSNRALNKISENASKARQKTLSLSNAGNKIKGVFAGTALGNAISNTFSTIKSGAENAIKEGSQLAETGNEVKESWQHIGVGNNNADAMVEQMDKLRDSAGMDERSIQRMQKSFYTFTGSASHARSLVNEVSAFGKASGESNQEITRMGTMLPRMLSTGKVRAQMFNRTFGQSGELVNALAKASGHSASSFRQLVDSGKLTSQQLQQYMQKAAKGSSHAWAQYDRTLKGQIQAARGMVTSAQESFGKPFVNNLTKSINRTVQSSTGLQKVQHSVANISTALGRRAGNFAGQAIGWIVKNQKPLIKIGSSLFRIIGAISSGVWKEFTSVLTGITGGSQKSGKGLNNMASSLSNLASHTKQLQKFGKVMINLFALGKLNKFTGGLKKLFPTLKKPINFGNSRMSKSIRLRRTLNNAWQKSGRQISQCKSIAKRTWRSTISGARSFGRAMSNLRHPILVSKIGMHNIGISAKRTWHSAVSGAKSFGHQLTWTNLKEKLVKLGTTSIRTGITGMKMAQIGFKTALKDTPIIGWIQIAIDGLSEIYMHSAKFRRLVNPMLRFIGKAIGWIGDKIADSVEGIIKFAKGVVHVTSKVIGFFHTTKSHAASTTSSMNRFTRNSSATYRKSQRANVNVTSSAHKSLDRYRRNSSGRFRAYISRNGKIYRNYHKGTTRISETTYKQREALRNRYYRRYASQLKKYEANYKKYETKRSSLSRKYGKLRAMYSVKSLRLIEKRFKQLRNTVVRYAKRMFTDTQHWFKRLGTGAGRQFKGVYRNVRKYLRMSNREAVKQFRALYRNSRRWLNGSVNKYVRELRYRSRKQKFYDKQLVKQAKDTGHAMYKLPLGWIGRETRDLVKNWRRQRHSFIVHNERMTHAESTHLDTMTVHMKSFRNHFESLMSDMEDSIYHSWSKFWDKMHSRTGSGMNSVQRPLNTGAEHINEFVRAFGETTSPMHEMPEVSYSTGTGTLNNIRRPITRMTNAVLNDGSDSPETNDQETVIRPNGKVEFPHGQNIHEMLEPGTEILNATETKMMGQIAQLAPTVHYSTGTGTLNKPINNNNSIVNNTTNPIKALNTIAQDATASQNNPVVVKPNVNVTPTVHLATGTHSLGRVINNNSSSISNSPANRTISNAINNVESSNPVHPNINIRPIVHLATGTGIFGGLFDQMSNWLRSAIDGSNSGNVYGTFWNQAKGRGNHKLLHVLQKVLSHSEQVLSGFMGNAPQGYHGALGNITTGIYGQTSNQIDSWWKALMNLTNQTLNQDGSSSEVVNYAKKMFSHIPYAMGGMSKAASDCSGMVDQVLRHFHVNLPRTTTAMENDPSQLQYIGRDQSKARAGDLALFGSSNGAGGHVGFYAGNGKLFNETPPYSRVTPMSYITALPLHGFYRIRALRQNSNQMSFKGANRGLMAFVKRQESPMLKWIDKHLTPLLDANPGGSGVARWRPFVEKALKANGFSASGSHVNAWMRVIARESNGNPHAVNHWDSNAKAGHPSEGLVQTIGPTFNAYAKPGHHNIFSGYDDLLAGIAYMAAKYGRGDSAFARVSGPEGYARGGHINAGQLATVHEHGYELFKPDEPGKIIPHNESKRILNRNNNSHPVKVEQHNTFNITGGNSKTVTHDIDKKLDEDNDNLADKLAHLFGFDEGGEII